ncbi:hypothetical protein GQX73_g4617 [Xylaria multiplex]|uniref:Heterokaryon incompatibility domain-containing protein n=1 Tax=Xylaria multiplex TaxID=323545 RepID=A0A7C8MUW9_9PEZI|nr:hypothetical protein GQX73_g4617 [Xylaria multiplex]
MEKLPEEENVTSYSMVPGACILRHSTVTQGNEFYDFEGIEEQQQLSAWNREKYYTSFESDSLIDPYRTPKDDDHNIKNKREATDSLESRRRISRNQDKQWLWPRSHLEGPYQSEEATPNETPLTNSTFVRNRPRTRLTPYARISMNSIPTFMGEDPFQYRPIEPTEFRLVRLLPENMSIIKCEVLHTSFEAEPEKYIAVSYTWGDTEPNVKIHLDGCSFYITSNLYGTLKRLRKRRGSVTIWVDALCINQRDEIERSQQVALMTQIYGQAESVVAWLGPELDNSELAFKLIKELDKGTDLELLGTVADKKWNLHFAAIVKLFERDFWGRLWVVQEILNAKFVLVYCGNSEVTWDVLQNISSAFKHHEAAINHRFPRGIARGSRQGRSYAHILGWEGPASINILKPQVNDGPEMLLDALRICRKKLAAEPRDKVFGILGILPESVRCHFPPDYNMSLRELYTNVVDMLLHTTRRVDVICDAIYFPIYTNTVRLPTWVPDWSHIPSTTALGGLSYNFSAASYVDAEFEFLDPPERTKLQVAAIYIDAIKLRGNPVWTFCTLEDYLMAFLHWHAKLSVSLTTDDVLTQKDEAFCRTLALGKIPKLQTQATWTHICYHVFTSLIAERLPSLSLDHRLKGYTVQIEGISPEERRSILQDNCASKMEGRCFFTTENGLMGMGSGFMAVGDIICVPLGCRTPIILRPDGNGEYRLVGDAYLDGYMNGRAVEEWKNGTKKLNNYVLH